MDRGGQVNRKPRCLAGDERRVLGEQLRLLGPPRDTERLGTFVLRRQPGRCIAATTRHADCTTSRSPDRCFKATARLLPRARARSRRAEDSDWRRSRALTRPRGGAIGVEQLENPDFAFAIGDVRDRDQLVGRCERGRDGFAALAAGARSASAARVICPRMSASTAARSNSARSAFRVPARGLTRATIEERHGDTDTDDPAGPRLTRVVCALDAAGDRRREVRSLAAPRPLPVRIVGPPLCKRAQFRPARRARGRSTPSSDSAGPRCGGIGTCRGHGDSRRSNAASALRASDRSIGGSDHDLLRIDEFLLRADAIEARPLTLPLSRAEHADQPLDQPDEGLGRLHPLRRGTQACHRIVASLRNCHSRASRSASAASRAATPARSSALRRPNAGSD